MSSELSEALSRVGDRWSLLVVATLLEGPRRFGDLQDGVPGISTNVLSDRLKRLERDGLLTARPYSERPVRLNYDLTASGRELAGVVRLLADWGSSFTAERGATRHNTCGTQLEARWFCPTCARVVDEDEGTGLSYA